MQGLTFVPKPVGEVLQTKLEIWQSRLAYARVSDKKFVPECEAAIADIAAKIRELG